MGQEKIDKFGEILLHSGIIDMEKLQEALETQRVTKKKLGEVLVEKGFITDKQLIEALSKEYQLSVVNASSHEVSEKILKMFSYAMLSKCNAAPLAIEDGYLVVAVNDPLDLNAIQDLKNISGYKIKLVLSTLAEIKLSLNKNFGPLHSARQAIREITIKKEGAVLEKAPSSRQLEVAAQEAPIVKLVSSIIGEAIKQNASDIHFEPQRENMRVRLRIDGILYEKVIVPKELQAAVTSRIKIISGIDIAEMRKPQDGRMSVTGDNKEYDIRVSTLPDIFGEKVVLRLLDKTSIILPLESLGLIEDELKIIRSLIDKPYGMILVTGPTGSGKTTTLYSMLNILNIEARNIVTVEDPVEYELNGINQTYINVRAGYTFATAIRHILRQNPDIIMIGEIRDLETAEIAIQAALTGHLVFSTIHTNSAPGVIARLIDMNTEPFLITSSVIGVIAQRLVRKLCPYCKQDYKADDELRKLIPKELAAKKEIILSRAVGCDRCYHTGYMGRVAIFELFPMDDDIRALVLKKASEPEISRLVISKGMRTLRGSGILKALEKVTSIEEVLRTTFVERE